MRPEGLWAFFSIVTPFTTTLPLPALAAAIIITTSMYVYVQATFYIVVPFTAVEAEDAEAVGAGELCPRPGSCRS